MTTASEALAEYMAAPTEAVGPERFRITTLEQANWASRVLKRESDAYTEIEIAWIAERQRLDEWRNSQMEAYERRTSHLRLALIDWHRERMEQAVAEAGSWGAVKGPKSAKLIAGTVTARRSPDSWEADPDAFVAWAESNGYAELVRVMKYPKVADAKKALAEKDGQVIDPATGEVVPGLTVHPGEIKYDVEVTG